MIVCFQNRFFLVDKITGGIKPIIYESESAFFFLHICNAYEDNGEVNIVIHVGE